MRIETDRRVIIIDSPVVSPQTHQRVASHRECLDVPRIESQRIVGVSPCVVEVSRTPAVSRAHKQRKNIVSRNGLARHHRQRRAIALVQPWIFLFEIIPLANAHGRDAGADRPA